MLELERTREDFERRAKRSLSMPIAGALAWSAIAILGVLLPQRAAIYAVLFVTGAIFPIAMAIAAMRGEQLLTNSNPLAKLMGTCVFMVNLLWPLHLTLLFRAPIFVPLSVGIGFGLHWAVYSWITRRPVGYIHAAVRTVAIVTAWWLFPANVVTACATAVVLAYLYAIYAMATRPISEGAQDVG